MATTSIRCMIGWHHCTFANADHTGVRSCTNCCERRYHGSHRATDVAIEDAPYGASLGEPSPDGMGGFSRITAWFDRGDVEVEAAATATATAAGDCRPPTSVRTAPVEETPHSIRHIRWTRPAGPRPGGG